MPDPSLIQAISGLGALGFAVIAVWAFATGKIRVGRLVDDDRSALLRERDEWKARSLASDARLDRIATAFERATKSSAPE